LIKIKKISAAGKFNSSRRQLYREVLTTSIYNKGTVCVSAAHTFRGMLPYSLLCVRMIKELMKAVCPYMPEVIVYKLKPCRRTNGRKEFDKAPKR
jgi:hypothetical protein